MNKALLTLCNDIKFDIPKSFEDVALTSNKHAEDGRVELSFLSDTIIPAKDIHNFLSTVNKNFAFKIRIVKIVVKSPIYSESNLRDYLQLTVKTLLGQISLWNTINSSTFILNGPKIKMVFDSAYKAAQVKEAIPRIEKILKKFGFRDLLLSTSDNLDIEKMRISDKLKLDEKLRENEKKFSELISFEQAKQNHKENRHNTFQTGYTQVNIDELADSELTSVEIIGEIFKIETVKTKTDYEITKFNVTNYKDAIAVKLFGKSPEQKKKNREFKDGDVVKIRGTYQIDSFSNQPAISARTIVKTNPLVVSRSDKSSTKRIEFNARTKMSAMESVIDPKALIKKALDFGHKSIAIVDTHSVQAFPDIYHASKGTDVKVIYGVSMPVLDRDHYAIRNPKEQELAGQTYVVFDLETTGLSPIENEIIEFGAVKLQDGRVVDRKQFFVKANKPIPLFITRMTSITQAQSDNGYDIKEALKEALDFIGDSTLIAHNATFDLNFMNEHLTRNGFSKISNPVIDTLKVERIVYPFKKYFGLKHAAKRARVEYDADDAHRADYDANVLAMVWKSELRLLAEMGITTQKQLATYRDNAVYARERGHEVTILAKNQEGLKELFKLVSLASTDQYFKKPVLFMDDIKKYSNIMLGSSTLKSRLVEEMLTGTTEKLIEEMSHYDYIEIQSPANYLHKTSIGQPLEEIQSMIKLVISEAQKQNKLIIATGDVKYLDPKDKIYHDVYVYAKGLGGGRHFMYSYGNMNQIEIPKLFYKTTEELKSEFDFLDDTKLVEEIVVDNTIKLDKEFDKEIIVIRDKLYTPKMDGTDALMKAKIRENVVAKYGSTPPTIVLARLKKELGAIMEYGFGVIYWISHLLVKKSLEDGYLVGSRGSVGSSFVATMLDITEVNPLAPHYICPKCKVADFDSPDETLRSGYDLPDKKCDKCDVPLEKEGQRIPFEAFLGFKGDKVPDIDLNFSGEYQPIIHEEVKQLFGDTHSFRAGTIATVAEKTAFGYVKAYAEDLGSEISKPFTEYLAMGVQGTKRTSGQHPGGIIVIPKSMDVEDFSPINYPANDVNADWKTTHFDFHAIHDNVLKLDLLGHDDPTAIRMLQNLTGIDPKSIPMDDEKVLSLFSSPEALGIKSEDIRGEITGAAGIPEFGTKFVRGMLKDAKPKTFGDLVAVSGLSHGTDVWAGNAEVLIKKHKMSLSEVVTCRDDIMLDLIAKGVPESESFVIMERVRKGKSISDDQEKLLIENKVPSWYIESLKKIKYMFPKAHATAYVMMAFRIAWFKVYHPLAYYATFFSTRSETTDLELLQKNRQAIVERLEDINKRKYARGANALTNKEVALGVTLELVDEALARGVKFGKLDVNKSDSKNWTIDLETGELIPPFSAVDGLGEAAAQSIIDARQTRDFTSIQDLMKRTSINKTIKQKLTDMGVLDHLEESEQLGLKL